MFYQLIISGIALGSVYALIALALVLIYKGAKLLNLAQGELVTLSAYFSFALLSQIDITYLAALFPAVIMAGMAALLVERTVIRPLIGHEEWPLLLATWGVSLAIRGFIGLVWGHEPQTLPTTLTSKYLTWGSLSISAQEIAIIGISFFMLMIFYIFFNKTKTGMAMQMVADNQTGASLCGINVSHINAVTWVTSGMVSAVAGITIAPIFFLQVDMGFDLLVNAFSAAILGGFGSIPGAIIGGYLLGVIQTIAGGYTPELVEDIIPFVILIIVLVVRPSGLFGKADMEKK